MCVMVNKKNTRPSGRSKEATNPADDHIVLPTRKRLSTAHKLAYSAVAGIAIIVATTVSLRIAYSGKIYPGGWGNGIYLGGLAPAEATKLLDDSAAVFVKSPILLRSNDESVKIDPADIGLSYNDKQVSDELMKLGRTGSLREQITTQWKLLLGLGGRDNSAYTYNTDKLGAILSKLNSNVSQPSVNASYQTTNGSISFGGGQTGRRIDYGLLALKLNSQLSLLNSDPIRVDNYTVEPAVDNATLNANKELAQSYVESPLTLSYAGKSWPVSADTALGWLHSTTKGSAQVYKTSLLTDYYQLPPKAGQLGFDPDKVNSYLGEVSKDIDRPAVDAQLNVTDGRATIFVASQNGQRLNTTKTRDAILESLSLPSSQRVVAMSVDILKPTVSEESLNSLGIKELLSEGVSYFPGSPPNRLVNVRTGAARFNGVLLKPGEVFSFGNLLGPVGPEQGYVPGLIILADHEEKAYGGGLCQVSSTAFRAALLAGLPILERTNHAFAISYYTAPYGVPGVDATIYYPPVDFKFRNDTDAHILIQTEMVGTTLKFRFYGTKKKEGVIRGPYFVSGSSDVNKPSQTVFYRDVTVNGQVTKTDTFNTYYKSALDFPVTD